MFAAALVCGCSFKSGSVPTSTPDDADIDQMVVVGDMGVDTPDGPPPPTSPRRVVFDNSASTVNFGNFPVLVPLTAASVDYAMVTDPTTQLRFEDEMTASDCEFEVESWNPGGESIVWVRVPSLPLGSTTTSVLMHFGPTAGGSSDPAAVWGSYDVVHHFSSTANSIDSNYAATFVNATMTAGSAGMAATFAADDSRVTFASSGGLFDGWQDFTLSFWIYADYASAALTSEPDVMDKGGPLTLGRLLHPGDTELRMQIDLHFNGVNNNAYLNANVPFKTWTHLAYQANGNNARVVRDGVVAATFNIIGGTQSLISGSQGFYLGSNGTDAFRGQIDELRIEQQARSLDYVRAQSLMMHRQFVTIVDP